MSLWKIAWRNIQQRWLASALTAFSISLGVALVVAVLVIHSVIEKSFRRNAQGYNMIVGAKGDPLLLVLNTVFHMNLRQPLQNIPYSYYEKFTEGDFVQAVDLAIPICTGHDYKGSPVIATIPEMFEKLEYRPGQKYEIATGRNIEEKNPFEAVVGFEAARSKKLKLGDTFQASAGASTGGDGHKDDEPITVVGILAPTGTPNDNVIFTNIEGFFKCRSHQAAPSAAEQILGGQERSEETKTDVAATKDAATDVAATDVAAKHDDAHAAHDEHAEAEAGHEGHDHKREITAILVVFNEKNPFARALPEVINRGSVAQAVYPTKIIDNLFTDIVGNIQAMLLVLAVLVVVVAGIGILVSIYNSMSERRHDIAVMRALGAGRTTVMAIILLESILLALGGGFLGVAMGHGLIGALSGQIAEQTRVSVSMLDFQAIELVLIPGLVLLASAVGYLPAVAAYRTDVAKSLHKD